MTDPTTSRPLPILTLAAAVLAATPLAPAQCPSQWLPISQTVAGPNGEVDALTIFNGNLIVAGAFTNAGPPLPQPASHIAAWNGTSWAHLGFGLNGTVLALAVYHGQVFATGLFTSVGLPGPPQTLNSIARWDGSAWSDLGVGLDFAGSAMAVYNDDLVVAGTFTMAGGSPNLAIARWHDSGAGTPGTWSSFGNGLSGQFGAGVYAVTVYNGQLIAAGEFDNAGGLPANRIARGDGATWQPLGGPGATVGVNSSITALAVFGADLVAGGVFGSAGGVAANRVARWNAVAGWSALGGGVNNTVSCFGHYGPDLYVGGQFTTVNSPPQAAVRVARWRAGPWSAVAGGVSGTPYAMLQYQGDLFVGGAFTTTDGQAIPYLARWSAPGLACPADYDCNHAVEPADISLFVNVWYASLTGGTLAGDFDGNGQVQPADIALFVQVWFAAITTGC